MRKIMKNRAIITEIPDDVIILEQCDVFKLLLKVFSKRVKETVKPKTFLKDLKKLEEFDEFTRNEMLQNKFPVIISPEAMPKVKNLINDFKRRYWYIVTWSDKYYVEIRDKLYWKDLENPEKIEKIKEDMRKFLAAYHIVKSVFEKISREWIKPWEEAPERYFNHLTSTMDIVLNELPNPNINTVVIALLHDSIEDIKWINEKVIASIFWKKIAEWVKSLSKKDLEEYYLSQYEIDKLEVLENDPNISKEKAEEIKKDLLAKAKLERQDDYFWHLWKLDDDILTIKFADRIHNLRTLDWMSKEQVIKKIKETEKYFLPIAKERNPVALKLINREILRLKTAFWITNKLKKKDSNNNLDPSNFILSWGYEIVALWTMKDSKTFETWLEEKYHEEFKEQIVWRVKLEDRTITVVWDKVNFECLFFADTKKNDWSLYKWLHLIKKW